MLGIYKSNQKHESIAVNIFWCISNLTAGSQEHILRFLKSDFYPIAKQMITNSNEQIQYLAIKTFMNILFPEFYEFCQLIIDEEFIATLIQVLEQQHTKPGNKLACLSVINNVLSIGEYKYSASEKTLEKLNDSTNNHYLNLFNKNGGSDVLQNLQHNVNEEIFLKAQEIIKKFYSCE